MRKRIVGILLSGILITTLFANSMIGFATKQTDVTPEWKDLETLSGVSIEQMQKDFENQSVGEGEDLSQTSQIETFTISEQTSDSFLYLSDLEYEPESRPGWGSIQKDKDVEGGTITLKVNQTVTYFEKGMGAHATSNIIYNVSQYNQEYTRLSTYVGVDHAKDGKSDGAQFYIWGSETGKGNWVQLASSDILKPSSDAQYFDVDIQDYDFIKLEARVTGSSSSDHTVYGDLRLLKTDYDVDSELYSGVKTVAEYDREIAKYSIAENYKNNKLLILKREFVDRIGYQNVQNLYKSKPSEVKETLDWLFGDIENIQLFIEAGDYFSGNGYNALNALVRLYSAHSDDMSNLIYKKMLLATAAAYCRTIKTFTTEYGGNYVQSDPVIKYESFKKLYDDDQFIREKEFESYPMELVRMVVDSKLDDSEIFWLRDWIEKKYPADQYLNDWRRYNGYGYTKYVSPNYGRSDFYDLNNQQKWDDKYGFLKYGISYGTNLSRVWMVLEHGAICWGLSGLANTVNEVQGIPAMGTYQPGHEAYLTYSENAEGKGIWSIGDNISGWSGSFTRWDSSAREYRIPLEWGVKEYNKLNRSNNTSYILLSQDALNDYDNYLVSMYYQLIANSYPVGGDTHEEALYTSLKHYGKNLDALYGLYKSYKADNNTTDQEWSELAKRVIDEYTYFPAPMADLLDLIQPCMSDKTLQIEIDMLEYEALTKASKATAAESLQDGACRQVASALLGQGSKELATFSFDGEHANTILINESYDDSTIQVRVSLDGGKTWEKFENGEAYTVSHQILLSEEQIQRINAEDDILVGLMGIDTNYKIDIREGNALKASSVYKNDDENLLIGVTNNLEYSTDGGNTWQDYDGSRDSSTRLEGNVTAQFRYKPYGIYMQGPEATYTFSENTDPETSQYLPIQYVTLEAFSSQNSTSSDHAAKNFIDGNGNTAWHTTFNKMDDKYYVVKFDQVRYINKLTYLPGGQNGRLKSGEIYASYNGTNWEKVHTFTGLANNTNWQTIDFGKNVEAKYLKLVATETYYNSEGERNMYLSGKMLNFYEDTTKVFDAQAEVTYSTTSWTNQNVTATLHLPTGGSAEQTEYVFEKNGTHEFQYQDVNGQTKTIVAEVNWIDKEAPTGTVVYSTSQPTNGDVIATLTEISETDVEIISEGGLTHTFTDNGNFHFILRDKAGNESVIIANVTWIDREAPKLGVEFNITTPTNQDVVATLTGVSEQDTILGDGSSSYTFAENGTYEFSVKDAAGNIATLEAKVSWIDKTAPTATMQYSEQTWTNQNVTVELQNLSEEVTFADGSDGTHTFTENGTYVFTLRDEAGNQTEYTAKVSWIDKTKPELSELFLKDTSLTGPTFYLNFNEEKVEILSVNDMELSEGKFAITENGVYRYKMRMLDTGYIMEYEVVVDWILPEETLPSLPSEEEQETEQPTSEEEKVQIEDVQEEHNEQITNDKEQEREEETVTNLTTNDKQVVVQNVIENNKQQETVTEEGDAEEGRAEEERAEEYTEQAQEIPMKSLTATALGAVMIAGVCIRWFRKKK